MQKKNDPNNNERFTPKNRFNYWFDNRMAKGSLGLIRFLIAASVMLAVLVACIILLFGLNRKGEVASVFLDSISAIINAEIPGFDNQRLGYMILISIVAIAGVLFTSVLIGIVTSALEEKIDNLKRGNSLVLEKGHIVVLGFYPGEYTLLRQLILAAAGKPCCVVIAENMDREKMEQSIVENLDIPKNFRIVCRTADITDPSSLEKCSVETCRTIIVSPTEDMRTIKAILAVSALLEEKGVPEISVNAIISRNEYRFPPSIAEANNISTLQTNSILAKLIAHSCTQTGLSETFREVFNFEGCEFYLVHFPGIEGLMFEELMVRMVDAVPAGIYREGKIILNPASSFLLQESDRILVFSEDNDSAKFIATSYNQSLNIRPNMDEADIPTDAVIIGHNETLPIILNELPENVSHVYLVDQKMTPRERELLEKIASLRELELQYFDVNIRSEEALLNLAKLAEHIIILNDHDKEADAADMDAIFLLLNLRDIRKRYQLKFNITVEMQAEHNQKLVQDGDHTDFLVASSMSSLILAQLAESPELISVFREILSNNGNELYLKNVGLMNLEGKFAVQDLRLIMLRHGYILLGYLDQNKNSRFNLPLDEIITLRKDDHLIVLGEN